MNNFKHFFFITKILFNNIIILQHGVGVEFVRFLPETNPPVLSNVFCELGVYENIVSIAIFNSKHNILC